MKNIDREEHLPNRRCMTCGKIYGKVCKVHVWVIRKIGSIWRPVRIIIKQCTKCCDPKEAQKIIRDRGWKHGPRQ